MQDLKLDPFEQAYLNCMLYGAGFVKITRDGAEAIGPDRWWQIADELKWQKENSINLENKND